MTTSSRKPRAKNACETFSQTDWNAGMMVPHGAWNDSCGSSGLVRLPSGKFVSSA